MSRMRVAVVLVLGAGSLPAVDRGAIARDRAGLPTGLAQIWDPEHVSAPLPPLMDHDEVDRRIDVNRDALRLQTPEGQILEALRDRVKPRVGFNLHNIQTILRY
jgi:hypothetical protein